MAEAQKRVKETGWNGSASIDLLIHSSIFAIWDSAWYSGPVASQLAPNTTGIPKDLHFCNH
jgi:hypothetical protein